jgi:hypothetical protein
LKTNWNDGFFGLPMIPVLLVKLKTFKAKMNREREGAKVSNLLQAISAG